MNAGRRGGSTSFSRAGPSTVLRHRRATAAPLTCWRVCCHDRYAKKDLKKLIKNKRALLMDAAQEDKHEFMDLRRCVRAAKMKVRLHSVASVPC